MTNFITPLNINAATYTKYTVTGWCSLIHLSEVDQAGTSDYLVQQLDAQGNVLQTWTRPAGKEFEIVGNFGPGDKPFQLKFITVAASAFFDGYEKL